MPKNRKQTFSDHQSDASREKKQYRGDPPKGVAAQSVSKMAAATNEQRKARHKKKAASDVNQIAAAIVKKTTENAQ
jgi:hypothetical protein